jgi:hypothetical protein
MGTGRIMKRRTGDGDAIVLAEVSALGGQPAGASSAALPALDGRTQLARRLRDLRAGLFGDIGGEHRATQAERLLIDRAAVLTLELESREARAASGEERLDLGLYLSAVSGLGRLLQQIGPRRARDITPPRTGGGGKVPKLHDVLAKGTRS